MNAIEKADGYQRWESMQTVIDNDWTRRFLSFLLSPPPLPPSLFRSFRPWYEKGIRRQRKEDRRRSATCQRRPYFSVRNCLAQWDSFYVRSADTILQDIFPTDQHLSLFQSNDSPLSFKCRPIREKIDPVQHYDDIYRLSSWSLSVSEKKSWFISMDIERNEWYVNADPPCLRRWINGLHQVLFHSWIVTWTFLFILIEKNFLAATVCFLWYFNPSIIHCGNNFKLMNRLLQISSIVSFCCIVRENSLKLSMVPNRFGFTPCHVSPKRSAHPMIHLYSLSFSSSPSFKKTDHLSYLHRPRKIFNITSFYPLQSNLSDRRPQWKGFSDVHNSPLPVVFNNDKHIYSNIPTFIVMNESCSAGRMHRSWMIV